jgi:ATP-dependent DNA helicase RecG
MLQAGQRYLVYGKISFFQNRAQIIHPEIELLTQEKQEGKSFLDPVYPTTEKLKARGLGGRQIGKLTQVLIGMLREKDIPSAVCGCLR